MIFETHEALLVEPKSGESPGQNGLLKIVLENVAPANFGEEFSVPFVVGGEGTYGVDYIFRIAGEDAAAQPGEVILIPRAPRTEVVIEVIAKHDSNREGVETLTVSVNGGAACTASSEMRIEDYNFVSLEPCSNAMYPEESFLAQFPVIAPTFHLGIAPVLDLRAPALIETTIASHDPTQEVDYNLGCVQIRHHFGTERATTVRFSFYEIQDIYGQLCRDFQVFPNASFTPDTVATRWEAEEIAPFFVDCENSMVYLTIGTRVGTNRLYVRSLPDEAVEGAEEIQASLRLFPQGIADIPMWPYGRHPSPNVDYFPDVDRDTISWALVDAPYLRIRPCRDSDFMNEDIGSWLDTTAAESREEERACGRFEHLPTNWVTRPEDKRKVQLSVTDISASCAGGDYEFLNGSLDCSSREVTLTFDPANPIFWLRAVDDEIVEPTETLEVRLAEPDAESGYRILPNFGVPPDPIVYSIPDNDLPPEPPPCPLPMSAQSTGGTSGCPAGGAISYQTCEQFPRFFVTPPTINDTSDQNCAVMANQSTPWEMKYLGKNKETESEEYVWVCWWAVTPQGGVMDTSVAILSISRYLETDPVVVNLRIREKGPMPQSGGGTATEWQASLGRFLPAPLPNGLMLPMFSGAATKACGVDPASAVTISY